MSHNKSLCVFMYFMSKNKRFEILESLPNTCIFYPVSTRFLKENTNAYSFPTASVIFLSLFYIPGGIRIFDVQVS